MRDIFVTISGLNLRAATAIYSLVVRKERGDYQHSDYLERCGRVSEKVAEK